jgi:undecaprenyl-diphosphatase
MTGRGLRLSLGLLVVVLGTTGFVLLADATEDGDGLAAFDPQLTADLVAHRHPPLSNIASAITFLGEVPVLAVLTVVAAILLRVGTRHWRPGLILIVGMLGAAGLTYGLKVLIGRHRPDASVVLGPVRQGFSFPSGHTLGSTVFFALLAAFLWHSGASRAVKLVGTAVALLMSLAIGLSRIYLGYHWATDVLAGWTVALTWLALIATTYAWLDRSDQDSPG